MCTQIFTHMVATSHTWPFKPRSIKIKQIKSALVEGLVLTTQ